MVIKAYVSVPYAWKGLAQYGDLPIGTLPVTVLKMSKEAKVFFSKWQYFLMAHSKQ